MNVLDRAAISDRQVDERRGDEARFDGQRKNLVENLPAVIYLDGRAFSRDCFGGWLQRSLNEFDVRVLADPDQINPTTSASDRIGAVIINTGHERMSSTTVERLLSRVNELLPGVPVTILSDYEDAQSIREAFEQGARGFIPTTLAPAVAVGAVQLVCVGGTFAPTAALLSRVDRPDCSGGEPLAKGFTHRQSQILDCLRRGTPNKLIAHELNMCESTVKVHIRNIMKKVRATNRTQVVYLTRELFEGAD